MAVDADGRAEPRFSLIFLYDDCGQILLQKRDGLAPKFPHMWACFGGGVERGEDFEQGVRRECEEELGYVLRAPRLLGCFAPQDYGVEVDACVRGVRAYFVERYDGQQELVLGEGEAMGWFLPQQALELDSPAHHLAVIGRFAAGEWQLNGDG